jgi:hypothetical protein
MAVRDPGWQEDLIERLVADATPVRRLWRPEARLLAWLALGIPLVVFPMSRVLRDDIAQQLRAPAFLLEEATMLVASALLALAALRASVPGRRVGSAISLAAGTALALGALLVFRKPVFTSWTPDIFLALGLPCLWRSFAWTLVPWGLLVIAVRRAAPLRSRWTGALVGAAAWGLTFGALRLCCQTEELTHLGVFHVLPFLTGTVLSAALGPVLFRERGA